MEFYAEEGKKLDEACSTLVLVIKMLLGFHF